jgi:hypothetical protein
MGALLSHEYGNESCCCLKSDAKLFFCYNTLGRTHVHQ